MALSTNAEVGPSSAPSVGATCAPSIQPDDERESDAHASWANEQEDKDTWMGPA